MKHRLRLTPEQLTAVRSEGAAYLVVAPPGSGKTEVLAQRVFWLLQESRDQAFKILALTFTTKAAETLRQRIQTEIKDQEWRVFTGTFHSFCLEVLKRYGEPVGISSSVTVYESDEDRIEALRTGLSELPYDLSTVKPSAWRGLLQQIDRLRLTLTPADAAPADLVEGVPVTLDVAYSTYEAILIRYGAIDFPGMLFKGFQLLTVDAWTANHYRQQYRHVLVDEAQDLNLAQYEILRALCGRDPTNVVLVADKNQSIYGFGGAKPELLDRYLKEFTAKALPLTINFRSAVTITELANRLAQHFGTRSADQEPMEATAGAPGIVLGRAYADELAEAKGVADWIEDLLAKGLDPAWISEGEDPYVGPEDIAVLARARFMLEEVHNELDRRTVECVVRATEEGLFDSALGRLVYYWLRVASNERDWPSRRRLHKLLGLDDDQGKSDVFRPEPLGSVAINRGYPAQIVELLVDAETHDVSQLIERLTASMSFDGAGHIDQLAWAHDQDELRRCWQRYAVLTEAHHRTLPDFLRALAQSQRAALDQPGVRLLTVHAAKGMEFRAVAVIGLNDGLFPYYLSLGHEDELNEERRSLYVAITRAARSLLLTRPLTRHTRYGMRRDEPSRFLSELGLVLATGSSRDAPF